MIHFFKKYTSSIALTICICLLTTILGGSVYAEYNYVDHRITEKKDNGIKENDEITVVRNDQRVVEVVGQHNGNKLYGTFDKETKKVTLITISMYALPCGQGYMCPTSYIISGM